MVFLQPKVLHVVGDWELQFVYKALKTRVFPNGCCHLYFFVRGFQRVLNSLHYGGWWWCLIPALGFCYRSNGFCTDWAIVFKWLCGHWPAELSWDEIFGTLGAVSKLSHSHRMNLASAAKWECQPLYKQWSKMGLFCRVRSSQRSSPSPDGLMFRWPSYDSHQPSPQWLLLK